MSLSTSKFPTLWKCSKVVALFKSGDKSNVTNYRPISILPTIRKILERAVFEQFYSYLSTNNLLSTKQFGFKHRLSTTVALEEFCDIILTGMENGKYKMKNIHLRYARIIYYNTIINPILEYNGIIWGDKENNLLVDSLHVFQKKAAKTILSRDLNSSATQALADLN